MNEYSFVVGGGACSLLFTVTAPSKKDAIKKANEAFWNWQESSEIAAAPGAFAALVSVGQTVEVTEEHIISEAVLPAVPEPALQLLKDLGFTSGIEEANNIDVWRNKILDYGKLRWTKVYLGGKTSSGKTRIKGVMNVDTFRTLKGPQWAFDLSAHYFAKDGVPLDGLDKGIKYRVKFESRMLIGEEEFLKTLPAYEKKYLGMIHALIEIEPKPAPVPYIPTPEAMVVVEAAVTVGLRRGTSTRQDIEKEVANLLAEKGVSVLNVGHYIDSVFERGELPTFPPVEWVTIPKKLLHDLLGVKNQ